MLSEGWIELVDERWKPKEGEEWFYMDFNSLRVRACSDHFENNMACGNCFRTEAEAQSAAEQVKKLLLSLHEGKDCEHGGVILAGICVYCSKNVGDKKDTVCTRCTGCSNCMKPVVEEKKDLCECQISNHKGGGICDFCKKKLRPLV